MIPTILIIPIIVGFIAQVTKYLWQAWSGNFDIRTVSLYGGMPSAHTAIVASLVTVLGLSEGLTSASFAVAFIFGIMVIRDAIGFRRTIGRQSQALNRLMRNLPKLDQRRFEDFQEQLGHTPLEAFVGAVVGFALSAILYLAFA